MKAIIEVLKDILSIPAVIGLLFLIVIYTGIAYVKEWVEDWREKGRVRIP